MKDFWKFQGVSEDDIETKYQTSEQRGNFQKDSQPEWVAAARQHGCSQRVSHSNRKIFSSNAKREKRGYASGFVAPQSKILFQYSPSSRLAIHLAALATNTANLSIRTRVL